MPWGLCLQEGNQRWISTVAQALQLLNTLYGPFAHCYGLGRCAKVCPPWQRRVARVERPGLLSLGFTEAFVDPADGA